jgi:hypothetical protein
LRRGELSARVVTADGLLRQTAPAPALVREGGFLRPATGRAEQPRNAERGAFQRQPATRSTHCLESPGSQIVQNYPAEVVGEPLISSEFARWHAQRITQSSRRISASYPRSTPRPGGGITLPAGAFVGSLPIVDCTPGFRIIQSWPAQPVREITNAPRANAPLINFDLLLSDYGLWGNLIDHSTYSLS